MSDIINKKTDSDEIIFNLIYSIFKYFFLALKWFFTMIFLSLKFLWHKITNEKIEPVIAQSYSQTSYLNYSDAKAPSVKSINELEIYLDDATSSDAFGFNEDIIKVYAEQVAIQFNELKKQAQLGLYESKNYLELASNFERSVAYLFRMLLSVEIQGLPKSTREYFVNLSSSFRTGAKPKNLMINPVYYELMSSVLWITEVRKQIANTNKYNPASIEKNLLRLRALYEKNNLKFPDNLCLNTFDDFSVEVSEDEIIDEPEIEKLESIIIAPPIFYSKKGYTKTKLITFIIIIFLLSLPFIIKL